MQSFSDKVHQLTAQWAMDLLAIYLINKEWWAATSNKRLQSRVRSGQSIYFRLKEVVFLDLAQSINCLSRMAFFFNNGSPFKLVAYTVFAVSGTLIGGVWFAARNIVYKSDVKEIRVELKDNLKDLEQDFQEFKNDFKEFNCYCWWKWAFEGLKLNELTTNENEIYLSWSRYSTSQLIKDLIYVCKSKEYGARWLVSSPLLTVTTDYQNAGNNLPLSPYCLMMFARDQSVWSWHGNHLKNLNRVSQTAWLCQYSASSIIWTPLCHFNQKCVQINELVRISEVHSLLY